MLYMVTFTINIPPMLAYIPYMDPMAPGRSPMAERAQPRMAIGTAMTWRDWSSKCHPAADCNQTVGRWQPRAKKVVLQLAIWNPFGDHLRLKLENVRSELGWRVQLVHSRDGTGR